MLGCTKKFFGGMGRGGRLGKIKENIFDIRIYSISYDLDVNMSIINESRNTKSIKCGICLNYCTTLTQIDGNTRFKKLIENNINLNTISNFTIIN